MTVIVKMLKRRVVKIREARFDSWLGTLSPLYLITHVHRPALFIGGWLVPLNHHLLRHIHPELCYLVTGGLSVTLDLVISVVEGCH